jgi:predicted DNA binding CopG/RHH family protein
MLNLDQEEQEILEAYESGRLKPISNRDAELEKHREYAAATLRKDARITICISSRDLEALRRVASIEGIPYQTLVASILHKFVNGRLVEAKSNVS